MDLPERVRNELDGEPVAARVSLGGEDELFTTPTRTLLYRAEGLLSDEAVETYPHDAERVDVSEGRRKSSVALDYGLDGERSFSVPTKRLSEALHPVLAGVLAAAGITDGGEAVERTFRFSELTLVVTDARVVKHVGAAVWDDEYEEFAYDDVTDLTFERGSVATSVVVTVGNRQERFKAPNEEARAVRETLESAILAHHGVESLAAFRATVATADGADAEPASKSDAMDFGVGPDPLGANPSKLAEHPENATRSSETAEAAESAESAGLSAEFRTKSRGTADPADPSDSATAEARAPRGERDERATERRATGSAGRDGVEPDAGGAEPDADGFDGSGFEPAGPVRDDALTEQLAALTEVVERQNEQLRQQRELTARLVEELRRGR
ncbi:DUF7115 domain-containing protein [Halegenticoccus tardaugens]|uniref:DUF7115 domain-containing protein n=1 Tax=Halegenticoccus tardaugens TaxID=2071624 RepID=UPI00100B9D74|nr:hypothetical protein [Halegenticoccus tardaugens]